MPKLTRCFRSCLLAVVLLVVAGHPAPGHASRRAAVSPAPAAAIYYVAPAGSGNCLSWATACELQDALALAVSGDQVWAAQGVYYPDVGGGQTPDSRDATFTLKAGVQLYGGFAGTETSLGERDWQAHTAVLSGDVDGNDIVDASGVVTDTANMIGNNSYHVVTGASGITQTARLDGFTITGGKADGDYQTNPCNRGCGGGMLNHLSSPSVANMIFRGNWGRHGGGIGNDSSSPDLANVTFRDNFTPGAGGGMYNESSSPNLLNVVFVDNHADYGGGIYNYVSSSPNLVNVIFNGNQADWTGGGMVSGAASNPTLSNVAFSGNWAYYNGGGMVNFDNASALSNVVFSGNQAENRGGGIFNDSDAYLQVRNTILWGNTAQYGSQVNIYTYTQSSIVTFTHSTVQGLFDYGGWSVELGVDGGGNLDADPLFVRNPSPGADNTWGTPDDDYGDLRLQTASPAIDSGANALVLPDALDLDGDGDTSEPLPYDLDAQPRIVNGTLPVVDMGAYEAQISLIITRIKSHPVTPSSDGTPAFAFSGSGGIGALTYQCVMDEAGGGAWEDCASPITYTVPLADGQHTFQVKAIDSASNQGTPASFTWVVDTTPPVVQITGMPADPTAERAPLFTFTASEPVTFYCTLDQNPEETCTSPRSYTALVPGSHTFSVYGRDAAGLASLPATDTWTVEGVAYVYYVKPGGSGECASWPDACELQTALGKSVPGDQVWVAQGVYRPGATREATFTLKDGVALYGGFAGTETGLGQRDWQTHLTVLSGDIDANDVNTDGNSIAETWNDLRGGNAYHVVSGAPGAIQPLRLDGFTITAGMANGDWNAAQNRGGGMYNVTSRPVLANLTFSGNQANWGGGMYTNNSRLRLIHVAFLGNKADLGGGGMENDYSSPSLVEVTFHGNRAYYGGGGMSNRNSSNPSLVNVIFAGNINAGMSNAYTSSPSLYNVTFRSNQDGGMINDNHSSPSLVNVVFIGNESSYGGGMHNSLFSNPRLSNVTFVGNRSSYGGAMYNYIRSNPQVHNSILWGNVASVGSQVYNDNFDNYTRPTIPVFSFSTIQGAFSSGSWDTSLGTDGGGNLDADPRFVRNPSPGPDNTWGTADDDYGDLRLQTDSPAIDAGNNALAPPDALDLDGDGDTSEPLPYDMDVQPRFYDHPNPDTGSGTPPLVDLGAYEAHQPVTVQVDSHPLTLTHQVTATFTFSSPDGGQAYRCKIDAAAWESCASPRYYTLADGTHTFQVIAVDGQGVHSLPASYTWVIDTQAPAVQITGQPFKPSNDPDPAFTFHSPDGGQAYQCKIDSAAWESCASPKGYNLPEGEHTFQVKATDAAGNEGAPASFIWTIDLTAPAAPSIASPAEGEIIPFTAAGWNRPAFSGQAEPGATVAVYLSAPGAMHLAGALHLNVQPLCTATANPAGEWTCPSEQPLPPGANRVTAAATDAAGNTGQPCAERAFVVQQVVYLPLIRK